MASNKRRKLVITVTTAPSWIYPEAANAPQRPEEVAETVYACYRAGASIAHIHGAENWPLPTWREVVRQVRERCDIIVQIGLSAAPLEERRGLFDLNPDMISVILNHHDECFTRTEINVLHTRQELEAYARLCLESGVKPELESWHAGSIWNLNYLIQRGLLAKPYFLTLFLGWPGGIWSPPTPDELIHRVRGLPPDSVYSVSVMDHAQTRLATLSMLLGGHVRVGTEDNPYYEEGILAESNSQLVERVARIGRELGLDIATPTDAREMLRIAGSR